MLDQNTSHKNVGPNQSMKCSIWNPTQICGSHLKKGIFVKNLGPRRKRMKRPQRLQSAKHRIPTYSGKNIIKGYRNWFGVDFSCAVQELRMLDAKLNEAYVSKILENKKREIEAKKRKLEKEQEQKILENWCNSDDNFYYIAGYTSGGFPYGLTWEEAQERGLLEQDKLEIF